MTSLSGLPYKLLYIFTLPATFHCHNFFHLAIFSHTFFFFGFKLSLSLGLADPHSFLRTYHVAFSVFFLAALLMVSASTPEGCYRLWLDCDHLYNLSQFIILYFWVSNCLSNRLISCLYCQHLPRTQTFIMHIQEYFLNITLININCFSKNES